MSQSKRRSSAAACNSSPAVMRPLTRSVCWRWASSRCRCSASSAGRRESAIYGSVWTTTSCMCGWPARISSSRRLAQLVGVRERHVGRDDDRHEDDQAAGGVQEAQLARRVAGAGERERGDAAALLPRRPSAVSSSARAATGCSSGSRWVWTSSTPGSSRRAASTRSATSWASPSATSGGHLEVQGDADAAVVLVDRDVVGLAHERLGERGGERAVAQVEAVVARLEVHDARRSPGSASRTAASIASAVPWPSTIAWPGRDGDHGVGEVVPAGLAQAQAAQLDALAEAVDRLLGAGLGVGGRGVHQHARVLVDEPAGGGEDDAGDDQGGDRVARLERRRRRRSGPQRTASEPAMSPAK